MAIPSGLTSWAQQLLSATMTHLVGVGFENPQPRRPSTAGTPAAGRPETHQWPVATAFLPSYEIVECSLQLVDGSPEGKGAFDVLPTFEPELRRRVLPPHETLQALRKILRIS